MSGPQQAQDSPAAEGVTGAASWAWRVPVLRAIPALIAAVVVTFTADHSAALGLITFGAFAALSGAILLAAALRGATAPAARSVSLLQAGVTLLAGAAALVAPRGGLPFLVLVLAAFAVITGFLELYLGVRARRRDRKAADGIFIGALTVLLAIVVLVVPPDFVQSFQGPDSVPRTLSAAVIIVGLLGAYWVVIGVFLVIAGLSLKWAASTDREAVTRAESGV